MTLSELTKQGLALLRQIIGQAYDQIPQEDLRSAIISRSRFIYLHARNICDLGDDVLALEEQNRTRASQILVRPMLESLFNLAAAVKKAEFATEKCVAEYEDEIKRIKRWIAAVGSSDQSQALIEEAERRACGARREYSVTTNNEWNIFCTAKAAELDDQYLSSYFVYSRHIHSTIIWLKTSELPFDRELVFHAAVYIVLLTANHIVPTIETPASQALINETARLWRAANKLIQS